LLKVGQEVLVQVSKDPIGTKGARVTSHISIPGRHLVFMPTVDHVGISRRISNERERRRLREIVDRLRPPGTGFIVRTVAENVPQEKLEADIRFLIEVWNETVRKSAKAGNRPGLLHPDLDLILRATRDLFAQDVEQLIIDDREEWERVQNFVAAQDSALKDRVVLHEGEEPIFDAYGIEEEIKRATARKVWLKSGGYLIIDQAEALTAVDVNSGRYVGKKNLEDTILKINIEAAKEIVYQLRLRNIGGIIICDFIDMEKPQNRDKVFKALHEALGRDKAKTNVLRISELGLVEMTRKRVRESIGRVLHEDCGYCGGQGYVKTATTMAYEIFRELRRSAPAYKDPTLVVQCQTEVANVLQGEEREELRHLMDRYNKTIQVRARNDFHREQYEIYARPVSGVEIKVAATQVEYDQSAYSGARKPGSSEARYERGGDRDRGGGRNRDRERGGRDRERNRGGQTPGGGGAGGGNPNRPRPSAPSQGSSNASVGERGP
jgi:ribonuclease G